MEGSAEVWRHSARMACWATQAHAATWPPDGDTVDSRLPTIGLAESRWLAAGDGRATRRPRCRGLG